MNRDRRHFLKMVGGGLGSAGLASMVERFTIASALADTTPGTDYKALVCIFMFGGNDGNNMVIPINTSNPNITYNAYFNIRNPNNLAIAQSQLSSTQMNVPGMGTFALHPRMFTGNPGGDLYSLWGQGKLAVVTNVGPLTNFMTRQQYQQGTVLKPYQLFSHDDQQQIWQTTRADTRMQNGWGGRISDRLTAAPPNDPLLPMDISVAGSQLFIAGGSKTPLVIAPHPTTLRNVLQLQGFGTAADEQARLAAFNNFLTYDRQNNLVKALGDITLQSNAISAQFQINDPTFSTVTFPNTTLGNQLYQAAKVIKLVSQTPSLRVRRQVFFCSRGGFDTHSNEINDQGNLLQEVSQAMRAFYQATVEIGVANQVTQFTMSDFGRTLQPTGSGGSVGADHGWGNHHLVVGGAVHGGNFYGRRLDPNDPTTIFPTLQLGGPTDTDNRGRWIPTVSVEMYAATLASWFGLTNPSDQSYVFPNLSRFSPTNLGFV